MGDLNSLPLPELFAVLTGDVAFVRALDAALKEDLGPAGDITTMSIIDPARRGAAMIVARREGIVAGLELVPHLLRRIDGGIEFEPAARDGASVAAGATLGALRGPLGPMLSLERTMLNYLGHLAGIATLTQAYVRAVADTAAVICDTRKTTPGLRRLEKYAVRCGGGTLHRLGLYDAALYKDNHLAYLPPDAMADVLVRAIERARAEHAPGFVEVEVDSLDQLERVLEIPEGLVDIILLDNMAPEMMRQAVRRRDECRSAVRLEASGGVDLANVGRIAETGVDRISVGAITHSAPWLDIALDVAA